MTETMWLQSQENFEKQCPRKTKDDQIQHLNTSEQS